MFSKLINRRSFVQVTAVITASKSAIALPKTLPITSSLASSLDAAILAKKVLIVMVSLDGCPFCKVSREHYLIPLKEQQNLAIVQVNMRSREKIKDFKGTDTTHDQLIRSWGVKVAPTVLFFGQNGKEFAERLSGAYIPDFYGTYLDERIQKANAQIIN
ncbi:MAG TPA: thioredoxin fold domain-containing protein [Burkholderiaceae bacterium]|nr:thioredoxin fold domain-containing protein [Burkholderiaceae bacterium]